MNRISATKAGGLLVFCVSSVAALGGLLFGYDTAVIAGTIEYIQPFFHLTDLALGWTVLSALLGSMAGAALAGWLGDRIGRKKAMLVCAVLFLVSAVWSGLVGSANELVLARILGEIGVGAASLLTPVYITEIAPVQSSGIPVFSLSAGEVRAGHFLALCLRIPVYLSMHPVFCSRDPGEIP